MEKIVEEVLKAEETAKLLVQKSREKAEKLKTDIEAEISNKLKSAREEAQELIRAGINQAKMDADREYQAMVTAAESGNESFLQEHTTGIEKIKKQVTTIITTPEFNRE